MSDDGVPPSGGGGCLSDEGVQKKELLTVARCWAAAVYYYSVQLLLINRVIDGEVGQRRLIMLIARDARRTEEETVLSTIPPER